MGFSWSLFFAQRISERLMSQVPSLLHSKLAVDKGDPMYFSDQVPNAAYHYVYVDNLGVLSRSRELVATGLAELTEIFNQKGLLLHTGEVGHDNIQTLGVSLDGANLTTSLTPERFHRVRQGVRGLLRRGRCSGKTLEIVVGHCTYCGLLHRGTLSVFHAVYKFIQRHYTDTVKLWPSVKVELRVFAGLMPFLISDWSRAWNDKVFISDASEEGFGICSATWPVDEVRKAGALKERLRFRRSGGHNARESALTAAGFVRDEISGAWRASELSAEEYLDSSGWEINQDFPEISGALLARDWETVQAGEWARAEHIVHLEARALVKSFEACHEVTDCCDRFEDFMGMLSWDIDVHFRWVPSELNPADGPSRLNSKVESKTLLRSLPLHDAGNRGRDWAEEGADVSAGLRCSFTAAKAKQDLSEELGSKQARKPLKLEAVVANPRLAKPVAHTCRSSDSSSSTSEPLVTKRRQRLLARRSRHRVRKYVSEMMESKDQGLTLLERKAVTAKTEAYYTKEYEEFTRFARKTLGYSVNGMVANPEGMDEALTKHFNDLFMMGHPAHRGDKVLASVMHRHPDFSKLGAKKLPHAWRSLKGWRRLAPGQSRLAFPLAVWAALACELRRMHQLRMAIFLLIGLSSYSRPSELLRVTVACLVAPSRRVTDHWSLVLNPEEGGTPSKVGEFDDSVLLDSAWLQPWAPRLFRTLVQGAGSRPLSDFAYSDFLSYFNQAATRLQLPVTPYQWRHSGPSIDISRRFRTLTEVQKRGRWKSPKSVTRYEKSGRLDELQWTASQSPAALPRGRVTSRGGDGRRGRCAPGLVRWRGRPGFYLMDLFSGSGGVSELFAS
ncbi:unnamed protein product [Symbiodinium sp. CCMP2592]|nr:unnamed protein product [Symbiodinium sp. CCMP2592]